MNAAEMLARCWRHQNPELFGREGIDEPAVPAELRYGAGEPPFATGEVIVEEAMGDPEAVAIT